MLRSQELQLRASEIRQRLNELAGRETLTAEERAEVDTLSGELSTVETQFRAAVRAEETEARDERAAHDGEGAEQRALMANVRLGRYLQAAVESRAVDGREGELNASLNMAAAGILPWAALDPGEIRANPEARADVAVTGLPAADRQTVQNSILARVFARSTAAFLRVDMPSVGVGEASYPVFATGGDAEMRAPGVRKDAEAATFTASICTPHRVSARYLWRIEDAAVLAGMESALREDLSMAMTDRIDVQILAGDGNSPNLSGFFDPAPGGPLDAAAVADDEDDVNPPAKAADFDSVTRIVRDQVDGKYAEAEGALRLLVGKEWYRFAGGLYRADTGDVSVNDYLRTRLEGYRVNANVIYSGGARKMANGLTVRGTQRAAVLPIWQGLRMLRDEVSGAASGEVALTAIAMVDFAVLRKEQYRYIKIPTA